MGQSRTFQFGQSTFEQSCHIRCFQDQEWLYLDLSTRNGLNAYDGYHVYGHAERACTTANGLNQQSYYSTVITQDKRGVLSGNKQLATVYLTVRGSATIPMLEIQEDKPTTTYVTPGKPFHDGDIAVVTSGYWHHDQENRCQERLLRHEGGSGEAEV